MTITDLLPSLAGRTKERKHRHADTIRRLRREKKQLLDRQRNADDYFQRLLTDRHQMYAAWQFAEQKRQEAEKVAVCALDETQSLAAEVAELRCQLAPYLAAEANAQRVDVPPMVRDTTAIEDQATGPIYVQTLRDAANAGILGAVTNPGRVHAEGVS